MLRDVPQTEGLATFESYCAHLEDLLESSRGRARAIDAALDGEPSRELRRSTDTELLRAYGIFFTQPILATKLALQISQTLTEGPIVVDPACGAGDLLLSVAEFLPIKRTVPSTLRAWGKILSGLDLFPQLVKVTRLRLALTALRRGATPANVTADQVNSLLPNIRQADALQAENESWRATHVVMNPPFYMTTAPPDCPWRTGRVNAAAIFFATIVTNTNSGTEVIAILPEVLRCGTSYRRWREDMNQQIRIFGYEPYGRFATWADVDVSVLHGVVQTPSRPGPEDVTACDYEKLSAHYSVAVGSVVPFRHPKRGPRYPYLDVATAPPWKSISAPSTHRQFSGTVFRGPFVAIRRNSRPEDQYRAVPTILSTPTDIAVENHLLVVSPRDGTLGACRRLLRFLARPEVKSRLDYELRCRHLTVSAVASLPWTPDA